MSETEILSLIKQALCMVDPKRRDHYERATAVWSIEELGCDSITTLDMIGKLEHLAGVEIPDEDLLGINAVGDLIHLVQKQREAAT